MSEVTKADLSFEALVGRISEIVDGGYNDAEALLARLEAAVKDKQGLTEDDRKELAKVADHVDTFKSWFHHRAAGVLKNLHALGVAKAELADAWPAVMKNATVGIINEIEIG